MTPSDVKQILITAGFPDNSIDFALAQCCFESGGTTFNSEVDLENNNLTGIEWADATWQKNCSRGSKMPAADNPNGYYAKFISLGDWAEDFYRIVHAQFCKANGFYADWNLEGRPIEATTLTDYVHRLKLNHYFESSESEYLSGLWQYLQVLNQQA